MAKVTRLVDRTGEIVPFRRSRVVRAILAAVRASGSSEEWIADKMADMVVYYLDDVHGDRSEPPTASDVDDLIEKALTSLPELAPIARVFIEGRQRSHDISELEADLLSNSASPEVTTTAQFIQGFQVSRIAASLMRENALTREQAVEIAQTVERQIGELPNAEVTTALIRELADIEVLRRGLGKRPGVLVVPRHDVTQWLFPSDDQTPAENHRELSRRASSRVLASYVLDEVHSPHSRDAHFRGVVHLAGLDAPISPLRVVLNAESLLGIGAGFGLRRHFPKRVTDGANAVARVARLLRACGDLGVAEVELRQFDTAFREHTVTDDALALWTAQGVRHLRLSCDDPSSSGFQNALLVLASEDADLRQRIELETRVSAGQFADDAKGNALQAAASKAIWCGLPTFRLRRDSVMSQGLFDDRPRLSHAAVLTRSGINLALCALESNDLADFNRRLDDWIEIAIEAMRERVQLLERTALRDLAEPVAVSSRVLRALVAGSRMIEIVPVGLAQAAAKMQPNDAQRVAQQILSYLSFKVHESSQRAGLSASLGGALEPVGVSRLHSLTLAEIVQTDPESPLRTGWGTGLSVGCAVGDPTQESALHSLMSEDALLRLPATNVEEFVGCLRDMTREGGLPPHRVGVEIEEHVCVACSSRSPVATLVCPVCEGESFAPVTTQRELFDGI